MSQYRVNGFQMMPPVVKNILIINVLMYLATQVVGSRFNIDLNDLLGLHWVGSEKFEIYQLVSYMFMHGNFNHIFFNMFAMWMFGSAIENYWGAKKFLIYYLITGFGAAFCHYTVLYFVDISPALALMDQFLLNPSQDTLDALFAQIPQVQSMLHQYTSNPSMNDAREFVNEFRTYYLNAPNVVGASGSVFGLLLAFGMLFPDQRIFLIFFPIPIKAKYFVMIYGAMELFSGLQNNPLDNVAHFAHLGGMLFGFFLIKYWQKNNRDNFYNTY